MGLAEVLRHLPRLLALRRALRRRVLEFQPDIYVGIDAPDFNLGIERQLKARGIRTVHYVSPSVWAWREGRARRIGRSADRVLCLFPMEPPIYARHGIDARYVGHPVADRFAMHPDRAAARAALGLAGDLPVLALLPGSRLGEIRRLGPTFLDAAARVAAAIPGLQVLAPMASAACRAEFSRQLAPASAVRLLDRQAHELMVAADVVLLASGPAALEAMLAKRPMVVGYRVSALTAWIVRRLGLMRTDRYALPNVLAGETVVPELMQEACTPAALADALLRWFREPAAVARLTDRFARIHAALRADADTQAAAAVAELLATPARGPER
jgi:lipid-A-disaccharide synthase